MARGRAAARGSTRRGAAAAAAAAEGSARQTSASVSTPAPEPTSSTAPTVASTAPARARGASRASTTTTSSGRFRPKNVRRDEAERDSLARQEEKKASERAADERKARRGRSRFRSRRSRGDAMGRGGFGRIISGASGPFSSGMGAGPSRGGSGWLGGGSGGSGSGGRFFKSESKSGSTSFGQGRDAHREARINADRLHIMSPEEELDSDDEIMLAALGSRDVSKMPMGIYRKEHKEAEIIVATTAELEAKENATFTTMVTGEEESLWVNDEPGTLPLEDKPEEGVWDTGGGGGTEPLIKKEPGADEDAMDVDLQAVPVPKEEKKKEAAAAGLSKVKKALPVDPESKMIQSDLDLLARELGAVSFEKDGAERVTELANKDGRLYLFQFPPLLPPLRETATAHVKDENAAVDLTREEEAEATKEEDDDDDDEEDEDGEDKELGHGFRSQLLSRGGMIGRLNVRRSGRVELDWGGHVLEMSPAAGMNFLTTAVIVEESDEKPVAVGAGATPAVGGDCVGMGKIMGRFTVAPVWSEEEDWNVTAEELEGASV